MGLWVVQREVVARLVLVVVLRVLVVVLRVLVVAEAAVAEVEVVVEAEVVAAGVVAVVGNSVTCHFLECPYALTYWNLEVLMSIPMCQYPYFRSVMTN